MLGQINLVHGLLEVSDLGLYVSDLLPEVLEVSRVLSTNASLIDLIHLTNQLLKGLGRGYLNC